jgi:hypothetical protein
MRHGGVVTVYADVAGSKLNVEVEHYDDDTGEETVLGKKAFPIRRDLDYRRIIGPVARPRG